MTLEEAFRHQAVSCGRLGSPFMQDLLETLADIWDDTSPLAEAFASYEGDIGPAGHSLPLRLCGGLHALVLSDRDAALKAAYPPHARPDAFDRLIGEALRRQAPFLIDWIKSPPQTNEVRRAAALIPMAHVALEHFDLPLWLSELGASGGLNLHWDAFALEIGSARWGPQDAVLSLSPDWEGPMPPQRSPLVTGRRGVDLNPLNPTKPDDLLRLCSYLWPDQPERLARTKAAATVSEGEVDPGDAVDWLETRLADAPEGHLHLIQNTVAWQYFPPDRQAQGVSLIEAAGARATARRPLAWMQMETEGDTTGAIGAALTLRLWPGDLTLPLGRADFHGRWIKWQGA